MEVIWGQEADEKGVEAAALKETEKEVKGKTYKWKRSTCASLAWVHISKHFAFPVLCCGESSSLAKSKLRRRHPVGKKRKNGQLKGKKE